MAAVDVPAQRTVVCEYKRVDRHVLRCPRCLCQRPDRGAIDLSNPRDEVEVAELDEISELLPGNRVDPDVLVLMREVLQRLSESCCGKALIEEWFMVTATEETVLTVDDPNLQQGVSSILLENITDQLTRHVSHVV